MSNLLYRIRGKVRSLYLRRRVDRDRAWKIFHWLHRSQYNYLLPWDDSMLYAVLPDVLRGWRGLGWDNDLPR